MSDPMVDAAKALQAEALRPSPSSGPSRQLATLMRNILHYGASFGADDDLRWGFKFCKERFDSDNDITALERLFHELRSGDLALVSRTRRRK